MAKRTIKEEKSFIEKVDECKYRIKKGFVPNMRVDAYFFVTDKLKDLIYEELEDFCDKVGSGGFIPAVSRLLMFVSTTTLC